MEATKEKSSIMPGSLTALRAMLCLVIAFFLAGTRAEAFFAEPQPAPSQNAPLHSEATRQNYDGNQYDALDSLIAAKTGVGLADEMAVLRQATTGKGNFGVGSASHADAMRLGNAWVGNGSRVASDGRTLIRSDGLRTFRPPSAKPNSPYATTGVQANFETLERTFFNGVERLKVIRNGHLDITP